MSSAPGQGALLRGKALLDLRRWEEAAGVLGEAVAHAPEDAYARCELARAKLGAGRTAEALEVAESAAALAPEWDYPHRLRALALRELGRAKPAVSAAEEAVRLDADEPSNWEVLADCRLRAGDTAGAREAAGRGLELAPEQAGLHQTLGDIAGAEERLPEARGHYRKALELDPEDPIALNNLGVVLNGMGRTTEAAQAFEAAARLDPTLDLARENVASTARDFVNGTAFLLVGSWIALQTVRNTLNGNGAVALVFAVAGLALLAYHRQRAAARRAELSPAAQRVLDAQPWHERMQIRQWRPWFWLVPSPVWFVLGVTALGVTLASYAMNPPAQFGWNHGALVGLLLLFCVLTGRRALRYGRRKGWWD